MTSQFSAHDVGTLIPEPLWRQTPAYRTMTAHVATLPDGELIGEALGLGRWEG